MLKIAPIISMSITIYLQSNRNATDFDENHSLYLRSNRNAKTYTNYFDANRCAV